MNIDTLPEAMCRRIGRTSTIRLMASISEVFPLFGPMREKDWAYGWNPEIMFSTSPLVEEKMIFRTSGMDGPYTWIVNCYDPQLFLVEYCVYTQSRIWFVAVSCRAHEQVTLASVTYTYTGLNDDGDVLNEKALHEMFRHDLRDWEEAINHYLATGLVLHPDKALYN